MKPSSPKVLVMRVGRLGDTVMATSIVEPLVKHFEDDVSIDWIAGAGASSAVLKMDRRINQVFSIRRRKIPVWLDPVKRRIKRVSSEMPYEALINLEFGGACDNLARAITADGKYGRPYFVHRTGENEHGANQMKVFYKDLVGVALLDYAIPKIEPRADSEPLPEPLRSSDFVLLHPGFSAINNNNHRLHKAWPMSHWRSLISHITNEHGHLVVITGTEQEQSYLDELIRMNNVHPLIGRSVRQETKAIEKARCVISVDTGMMHLSAALGAPTIALFGPTDPARTGPHPSSKNAIALVSNVECRPCYGTTWQKTCTFNGCMHELAPQLVSRKLDHLLDT